MQGRKALVSVLMNIRRLRYMVVLPMPMRWPKY